MIDLRSISRRALLVATSSSTFALLQSRFAHAQDLASDAANRAVEISQLEADRDFDAIYNLMHPDAQAIIPREAAGGWYRDFLADQDAGVLTVTGVSIVSWIRAMGAARAGFSGVAVSSSMSRSLATAAR